MRVLSRCTTGLILAPLLALAPAYAAPAPWGALSEWDGHYPTDEINHQHVQLLKTPAIRTALTQLLSSADLKLLSSYAVEQPVTRRGSFLIVTQCRAHDCGSYHATIIIDTEQDRLWVGLLKHAHGLISARWFATSPLRELPASILSETVELD